MRGAEQPARKQSKKNTGDVFYRYVDNEDGSQRKLRGRDADPDLYEMLLRMDYDESDSDEVEATVGEVGRAEGREEERRRGSGDGEGRGGRGGGKREKGGRDSEEELPKPRNRLSKYNTMSCGYAADGSIRRLPKSVLRYSKESLLSLLDEVLRR
jgi:hypothetical protein